MVEKHHYDGEQRIPHIAPPDEEVKLEVRLEEPTAWLNRLQQAELSARDVKTTGKHINESTY